MGVRHDRSGHLGHRPAITDHCTQPLPRILRAVPPSSPRTCKPANVSAMIRRQSIMPTGQVADELVRQGVISGVAGPPVAPSVPPELVRSDGSWSEPPDLVQTGSGYPTEPTFTMPQQLNPKPSEQRRVCPILIWSWSYVGVELTVVRAERSR